jgi:hypothetical protein
MHVLLCKVVVRIIDLKIMEQKGQPKSTEMIPIFFFTLIIQLCINKTKDVLHTNCIALCKTSNMGQHYTIRWLHEKGTFINRIGHTKHMYGHMTLTPRY